MIASLPAARALARLLSCWTCDHCTLGWTGFSLTQGDATACTTAPHRAADDGAAERHCIDVGVDITLNRLYSQADADASGAR
jgi:hypothetical protein